MLLPFSVKVGTVLTLPMPASTRSSVLGFDVISLCATAVVVIYFRSRKDRVERCYFRHNEYSFRAGRARADPLARCL